jgi:hypothetical protein
LKKEVISSTILPLNKLNSLKNWTVLKILQFYTLRSFTNFTILFQQVRQKWFLFDETFLLCSGPLDCTLLLWAGWSQSCLSLLLCDVAAVAAGVRSAASSSRSSLAN